MRYVFFILMISMGFTQCIQSASAASLTASASVSRSSVDYTQNARRNYLQNPKEYCLAYEAKGRLKAKEYCLEAQTDGCIVYIEECLKIDWNSQR